MRLRFVATAVAAVVLILPAAARADGITATCTAGGSADACNTGWYTTDVTVAFILPAGSSNPQGCGNQTVNYDTAGATFTCTVAVSGSQCCRLDVTIRRDATAPNATGIAADRGPDVNGWYNHPLSVTVTGNDATSGIASCTAAGYSGPDSSSASVTGNCHDNAGNVSNTQSLSFRYDGTAPSVTPSPSRGPDSNGWYTHPVDVAFKGSDAVSGVDSCSSASYSGPDSGSASVSGSCRDSAGNTASATFSLQYDATAPSVTGATPDRPPDVNGWYNHPVTLAFSGSDATSGIASCDAVTYSGPNDPSVTVSGRCHDNAGNISAPGTFALKYDSTPPKLTALAAEGLDRSVSLKWKDSNDVAHLMIQRAIGAGSPATVYDGRPISSFAEKHLRNGVHYTYTVSAMDVAGNPVVAKIAVAPSPPLIAPVPGARVHGGVTLRWRPVPKASYYNVQLWLKGTKVWSTWPSGPSLHVPGAWQFGGHAFQLVPGRYVWHVWPGFGRLSRHHYGPQIGTSTFLVTR